MTGKALRDMCTTHCKDGSLNPTAKLSTHPQSVTFLHEEALFSFAKIFDSNVEDLSNELYQIKRVLDRKEKSGMRRLTTLPEFVTFLELFKEVFHELFRLGKIAVVIPVSSASCERSFSALALIKNHLRTTMGDTLFESLGCPKR